jgi:two-component system chemotaxis sensor kinase CheA
MAQLSELTAAKIRAEQRLAEAGQMRTLATAWQKQWVAQRGPYHRLLRQLDGSPEAKEMAPLLTFVNQNQEQLRQFAAQSNHLYRQFANDMTRLSLVIDELEAEMKRVRMLPLSTITTPFYRMVRDLARQQAKQIALTILGSDMQLDRRLLEQVKDPLIHLLRNAVDHGIEPTAVRQQNGKPLLAAITLAAGQQGNNITLTVSDDGAGLDGARLRETAVRKNILTRAQADALSDAEAANLIFRPSFSTSQHVTELSGRGVGLDVARQNVEALNGSLSVASIPGKGATFTLILPLTLASSRGLLLTAGGQTFALPLNTVERLLMVDESEIVPVDGRDAILYQGKPVALAHLADLLELPVGTAASTRQTVVIISVAGRFLGLVVDSLEGEQEIVIKNLGLQLVKVGGFMGATTLGTGQNILVLHAADLLKLVARNPLAVIRNRTTANGSRITDYGLPPRRKTILVVDDSITTRTLEKNILEANGYEVRLATNGEEALTVLIAGNGNAGSGEAGSGDTVGHLPDLIITDITMPRMNGFDLTRRLKQDGRTKDIPVILVTALDSSADKARGIEVGADAYIVKSRFDQGNLLAMIEQLTL